jgi:hypothetical protein
MTDRVQFKIISADHHSNYKAAHQILCSEIFISYKLRFNFKTKREKHHA